jgi:hypothetical protein
MSNNHHSPVGRPFTVDNGNKKSQAMNCSCSLPHELHSEQPLSWDTTKGYRYGLNEFVEIIPSPHTRGQYVHKYGSSIQTN